MAPGIKVVKGVPDIPGKIVEGPGAYSDLVASDHTAANPITAGVWYLADISEPTPAWEADWDEVKYVLRGEATFKDESTKEEFTATAGDFIWFPAGAVTSLVRSENLATLYTEQRHANWGDNAAEKTDQQLSLDKKLEKLVQWFKETNPKSAQEADEAADVLPGGNTRTVLYQTPFPLVLSSGQGANVHSKDGVEYLDFVSEFSAAMYGHSHPKIQEAVQEALSIGFNLGSVIGKEAEFGKLLQHRFPSLELLRFANSGTEANTLALVAALAHSGQKEVLVFGNGYHGSTLSFPGGSNPVTNLPYQFIIGEFNNIDATRKQLHYGIGAILVEPLQSSGGLIPAKKEFLQFLRQTADSLGAVLIFDEVVTSRFHYHGLQEHYDVKPDLTTLGKYIGGGFSFGCFGGKREIMQQFDPSKEKSLSHSGTFNNNVFTMTAGIAGMKITTPEEIARINALGDRIRSKLGEIAREKQVEMITTGYGSAVGMHFMGETGSALKEILYFMMLQRGIVIGRRGFVMLNMAHTEEHIDKFLKAFEEIIRSIA